METTQLYIELIIIGLETICWMCVCITNIIGYKAFDAISGVLNNFASSILVIGILYTQTSHT